MQKLVITCIRGGINGRRFEFDGGRVTIGRRAENDIAFDASVDRKASGRHAELRFENGRWVVMDLASTNGTFVGDQKVQGSAQLTDGCNVECGKDGPVLHVRLVGEPRGQGITAEEPALDETGPVRPPPERPAAPGPPLPAGPPRPPPPGAALPDFGAPQRPAPPPPAASEAVVSPPASGRTAIYRAMMVETVKKSSLKLKIMIGVLAGLLLIGSGVAWWIISGQEKETDELRRKADQAAEAQGELQEKTEELEESLSSTAEDLTAARERLAGTSARLAGLRVQIQEADGESRAKLEEQARALEATRSEYETQLQGQERQLAELRRTGNAAEVIASNYEKALFMLIAKTPQRLVGYCTAFAINRDGLLATNAHCVRNQQTLEDQGIHTVARMNRDPAQTFLVTRSKSHPDYDNTAFSADVAIVQLDLHGQTLPVSVELGDEEAWAKLRPGQAIYTMGYPGKVMNEARPAADFRAAVISRLTNYENAPDETPNARVVWHSALTSKGTSGSPIFNADGRVVAVNNGGLSARRVYTKDAVTGALKQDFAYDATGLNFGIRVDALHELLR